MSDKPNSLGYTFEVRSRYRNEQNRRLLSGLFLETRPYTQAAEPLYTLKDWDHTRPNGEKYPSLYLLYMSEADLTEYLFANKHLDGWEHWQMLCKAGFFKPYIARWREELALKIKAEALQRIQELAKDATSRNHAELNKYLANEAWKVEKTLGTRGRPTKAQVASAAKEEALALSDLKNDFERMFGSETKVEGSA